MGEGVDPLPPLSRIRSAAVAGADAVTTATAGRMACAPVGPCWFSISHWTTASLGALCPLLLRPSDAAE